MILPFIFMMNVVLLTRLFYHYRDNPLSLPRYLTKSALEAGALLLFQWNVWMLLLAPLIVLLNLLHYFWERNEQRVNLKRLIFLGVYVLLFSTFFSPAFGWKFQPALQRIFLSLASYQWLVWLVLETNWKQFHLFLFGILLSLNEVNLMIRYLFEVLNLVPRTGASQNESAPVDQTEYNRGRVIGFLERVLIFFFVLNNQFTAIGFVLTAKGITRFKELNERSFAEYFLIGTLLSSTFAGLVAAFIKFLT